MRLKKIIFFLIGILLTPLMVHADDAHEGSLNDLLSQVHHYSRYSYAQLSPYFTAAGLSYAPKKLALLIFKKTKRLELWGSRGDGVWHHVKDYPILAASGGPGPKLLAFDHQVPEGIYHIRLLNPDSHFHLSMQVSYPNQFDIMHAERDGRTHLGGDIFIHGSNRSIGCIAIGNDAINQLFVLAFYTGIKNILVIIAPNDLRSEPPFVDHHHASPAWLPELYQRIKQALQPFKKPSHAH